MDALSTFPPALILLVGALLVACLPVAAGRMIAVVAPAVALWQVACGLAPNVTLPFLDYELVVVRADPLSLVFGGIFALIGIIAGVYAWHAHQRGHTVAALIYNAGALGVTFAGDMITLYAFWELMAVASVVLIWSRGTPAAHAAGRRYILVHLAGGSALLAGILLYAADSGSIAFDTFEAGTRGAWLVLAGFCLNAALPPLGAWLPDAYPQATITGAIYLSSLTTKTAVYALLRGFAGWEILVAAGVIMALYGVVYAVLANNIRELLAYHIISQVGYMVAGAGIGTEMAINGAAAHAVCHILYKSLLFMGAGVVLHTTGRECLTELGGFWRRQKLVFGLYMIGAFSISGFPGWNGFVSKSMVIAAAGEAHLEWVFLLLTLASVGTFLHTGLKLPYFTWMGPESEIQPKPVPVNMIAGMALSAFFCTFIGLQPGLLYKLLPHQVHFDPYTATHLVETIQILVFTALAFWLFIPSLGGERTVSMDTDVLYRKTAGPLRLVFVDAVSALFQGVQSTAELGAKIAADAVRDPTTWLEGRIRRGGNYDADRHRAAVALPLTLTLITLVAIVLWSMA